MEYPRVLIAFGVKDEAHTLPKYLDQIDKLDYPEDKLGYAVVTSPSSDNTVDIVLDWLKKKKHAYWQHVDVSHVEPLRRRMFTSTNYIRHYILNDFPNTPRFDYMFQCDGDVIGIPPETLKTLIGLDVDIVAPYIYTSMEKHPRNRFRNHKTFRDVWGFRFKYGPHPGLQFNSGVPEYYKRNMDTVDSINADRERGIIPMLSVGANPILIKREVLENVRYDGLHATPGWCIEADRLGYGVWSYPALECVHDWRS